ncbi:hypothetical protein ACLB2K_061664 [Fragaria x ananassa]
MLSSPYLLYRHHCSHSIFFCSNPSSTTPQSPDHHHYHQQRRKKKKKKKKKKAFQGKPERSTLAFSLVASDEQVKSVFLIRVFQRFFQVFAFGESSIMVRLYFDLLVIMMKRKKKNNHDDNARYMVQKLLLLSAAMALRNDRDKSGDN